MYVGPPQKFSSPTWGRDQAMPLCRTWSWGRNRLTTLPARVRRADPVDHVAFDECAPDTGDVDAVGAVGLDQLGLAGQFGGFG
jgi:hypothetical protein